ncbi:MAG TPA: hypothetical protein VFU35_10350 [Jatrophihabitans sp.]|nr:hypothetical protein [Jatrophihabitans sp.]
MRVLSVDARVAGRDRVALAGLIESAEVDVACVHNGPHLLRWRAICAAIGRRSGLVVVTGGRPAGGNLLLSTLGVDVVATGGISFAEGSTSRPAGAALACLRRGGTRLVVVSATLSRPGPARAAQAARLTGAATALAHDDLPTVICIHDTQQPRTAAGEALAAGRSAVGDRVFVDQRLGVAQSREMPEYASGGLPPLVVDIGS